MHGGKTPVIKAKAEERMRELVHPAISALQRLIDHDDLGATKYVLDYAGFKASDKIETDAEVTIVVRRVDQPILDVPS
jgi:hypothetical protein